MTIYIQKATGEWAYYADSNDINTVHAMICRLADRGIFARWSNQWLGNSPKMVG